MYLAFSVMKGMFCTLYNLLFHVVISKLMIKSVDYREEVFQVKPDSKIIGMMVEVEQGDSNLIKAFSNT